MSLIGSLALRYALVAGGEGVQTGNGGEALMLEIRDRETVFLSWHVKGGARRRVRRSVHEEFKNLRE